MDYDALTEVAEIVVNSLNNTDIPVEHPPAWQTWVIGLAFVTLCSFSAPVALLILPCLPKLAYERVMMLLISLGIGTLSGSCFFILIPEAFDLKTFENSNYSAKSFIMVSSIYAFLLLDRLLQYFLEYRRRRGSREQTARTQSKISRLIRRLLPKFFLKKKPITTIAATFESAESRQEDARSHRSENSREIPDQDEPEEQNTRASETNLSDAIAVSDRISLSEHVTPENSEIASFAYLIIIGSSANNFLDAMSLGTAFTETILDGVKLGIASYAQQLPQEIGTLAILVHSGLGLRRTIFVNFIPAVLSYIGFCVGVVVNSLGPSDYSSYVFSVSSGMYLYVFLGTLVPEIRTTSEDMIKTQLKESILYTCFQFFGIAFGLTFIYFMDKINA